MNFPCEHVGLFFETSEQYKAWQCKSVEALEKYLNENQTPSLPRMTGFLPIDIWRHFKYMRASKRWEQGFYKAFYSKEKR